MVFPSSFLPEISSLSELCQDYARSWRLRGVLRQRGQRVQLVQEGLRLHEALGLDNFKIGVEWDNDPAATAAIKPRLSDHVALYLQQHQHQLAFIVAAYKRQRT